MKTKPWPTLQILEAPEDADEQLRRKLEEVNAHTRRVSSVRKRLAAEQLSRDQLLDLCAIQWVAEDDRRQSERQLGLLLDYLVPYVAATEAAVSLIHEGRSPEVAIDAYLSDPRYERSTARDAVERLGNALAALPKQARTSEASKAAKAKHAKDPRQKAKEQVYELFLAWQQGDQSAYRSAAAFARDMLDKFPDELSSQQVVERWVAGWRRRTGE